MDSKTHVLLYPWPSSGHIIPLLDLAHRLLTRGLSVTMLVTPDNLPLLSAHPIQPLVVPLQPSPPSTNILVSRMRSMRESHYSAIVHWFRSHPTPPVAIISDFFIGWSHHLACLLGIKRLLFSPSGASSQALNYSLWRDLPEFADPDDEDALISFPTLPGLPVYPLWQISHHYRNYKEGDSDCDFFRDGVSANSASWGLVYNSFTELEQHYLDHTKEALGHDRVWAVGPLLPPLDDSTPRGGGSTVPTRDLMAWLDARADDSVAYVCFGSRTVLTRAQMNPLAEALEHSGVHFVWCVRQPDERHVGNDIGEVPEGFEDRVAERGLVVRGWAPQLAVLRHRAVGVFLTHCGWNSVLEGLSADTVMLTWPQGADQFTNAKLLVDQLRVGIRVGEETRTIPDPDELGSVLRECVSRDGRKEEKARTKEMKDKTVEAVKGGSSEKQLDDLVCKLKELKTSK